VHRTAVGEANVAGAVLDKHCVIGGEGNGGVIDPRVVAVRDSFTGMGLVLNLLARTGQRLSAIVDAMPRYVMVKKKLELPAAQIAPWLERVRAAAKDARVDTCDGVRIDWPQGWVHVRPSNTEPIARVIAEASDEATANELAQRVMALQ
jgi:phosphomannomutase